MPGGGGKQSCPFCLFPGSALPCQRQRLLVSSPAKDVIVDAGGERDTGIPFAPGSGSMKNSSALRLSSAIYLNANPHQIWVFTKRLVTFFFFLDVDVLKNGSCSAPRRTRPWPDALGSEEGGRGRLWETVPRPGFWRFEGFPTQVAGVCRCSRCLASRNLQNAHPFAEVSRMGGGGGMEGEGDSAL